MKVCLVYRESRPGGFSIEEIFNCMQRELGDQIEFIVYQVDPKRSRWSNIRSVGMHGNFLHVPSQLVIVHNKTPLQRLTFATTGAERRRDEGATLLGVRVDGVVRLHLPSPI